MAPIDVEAAVADLEAATDTIADVIFRVVEEADMNPARAIYATACCLLAMVEALPAELREQAMSDVVALLQGGLAELAQDVPEEAVTA